MASWRQYRSARSCQSATSVPYGVVDVDFGIRGLPPVVFTRELKKGCGISEGRRVQLCGISREDIETDAADSGRGTTEAHVHNLHIRQSWRTSGYTVIRRTLLWMPMASNSWAPLYPCRVETPIFAMTL